jgi:hypothetical protein
MMGMVFGLVTGLATLANGNFAPVATEPPKALATLGYTIVGIAVFGCVAAWWLAIWSVVEDVELRMRTARLAPATRQATRLPSSL